MSMELISSLLHFGKKEGKILSKDLKLWQEGNKIPHNSVPITGSVILSPSDIIFNGILLLPHVGGAHTSDL